MNDRDAAATDPLDSNGELDAEASPAPDFVTELSRAVRDAAKAQHDAMTARLDALASERVEQIKGRSKGEADELRRIADEDVAGIRGWARLETRRIREEADRRAQERRARLDVQLAQRGEAADADMSRIHASIAEYRDTLDAFFARLDAVGDPEEFARMAAQLPRLPDLEARPEATQADVVVSQPQAELAPTETEVAAPDLPPAPVLSPAPDPSLGAALGGRAEADAAGQPSGEDAPVESAAVETASDVASTDKPRSDEVPSDEQAPAEPKSLAKRILRTFTS